jgi:hypothetical protein
MARRYKVQSEGLAALMHTMKQRDEARIVEMKKMKKELAAKVNSLFAEKERLSREVTELRDARREKGWIPATGGDNNG